MAVVMAAVAAVAEIATNFRYLKYLNKRPSALAGGFFVSKAETLQVGSVLPLQCSAEETLALPLEFLPVRQKVIEFMRNETPDPTNSLVIDALAETESGISAEGLAVRLGLDKMLLFYQLDRMVKAGLVRRSRPMFMEPELYEVTELGRRGMPD